MVCWAMVRISRPVRPACWAEASSITPTSRPGLGIFPKRRPENVTEPDVGRVRPTIIRIETDLPAPFGPRNPVTLPVSAVKQTSSTTVRPPYFLDSESMVIIVDAPGRVDVSTLGGHRG